MRDSGHTIVGVLDADAALDAQLRGGGVSQRDTDSEKREEEGDIAMEPERKRERRTSRAAMMKIELRMENSVKKKDARARSSRSCSSEPATLEFAKIFRQVVEGKFVAKRVHKNFPVAVSALERKDGPFFSLFFL